MLATTNYTTIANSRRYKDTNGYLIIKDNPIIKSGVFQYLESEIIQDGDANKIVNVYRPFSSLSKIKDDFAKKPILYNHSWVGIDKNSVDGAIGDIITSNEPYLVADLIIYNPELISVIESDFIKELSPGYESTFEKSEGVFNGEQYSYIQTINSVNHLAIVEEGRSGKDLRILDSKNKGLYMNNNLIKKVIDSLNIKDEGENIKKEETIKEKITNDEVRDRREIIREIMAIASRDASSFEGGETEQIETIAKKAEELAYGQTKDNDMKHIVKDAEDLEEKKETKETKEIKEDEDEEDKRMPIEVLKQIIEKVTDEAINKKIQSINVENKKIFDSYQLVKSEIGDFNYNDKSADEIFAFGYEMLTGEKLNKTLDARTAFLFASKNNTKTYDTKTYDSDISDTKIKQLTELLNNL